MGYPFTSIFIQSIDITDLLCRDKIRESSQPPPSHVTCHVTIGYHRHYVMILTGHSQGYSSSVIYEPVPAVAVPKCSVCALPTRHMRHPVVVTKLLSLGVPNSLG